MRNNKLVDITTNALSPHHTKFHLTENFYCGSPASRAHGNISSQMKFATLHGAMCYIRHGFAVPPSPLDRRSQWNLNRRSQCIEGKAQVRIKISCQHNTGKAKFCRHNKGNVKLNSDHQNSISRQPPRAAAATAPRSGGNTPRRGTHRKCEVRFRPSESHFTATPAAGAEYIGEIPEYIG